MDHLIHRLFRWQKNHQQCWWYQKALAMVDKCILLWYNKIGRQPKTLKTKGGTKS